MKQKFTDTYTLDLGKGIDSVATPVGTLIISPNPKYNGAEIKEAMKINVYHTPTTWRVQGYTNSLNAVLASRKASVINLSIADHSRERAADILNTVIDVYNEKWIEDKNRMTDATADFIGQRLDIIKNELLDVDREITNYKSKMRFLTFRP